MTGYGKSVVLFENKKICVEIRSLNGKAMDLSTRIAPQYKANEMEARSIISAALERGKVDLSIWVEQNEKVEMPSINIAVMQGYIEQMQAASEATGISQPEDMFELLLRMPDVVSRKEVYEASPEEWEAVRNCLHAAIEDLLAFRKQEGEALAAKFRNNIANISSLLASVELYEKERVEKIRARIKDTLDKQLGVDYDNNRFEQELIFYIEKLDVFVHVYLLVF